MPAKSIIFFGNERLASGCTTKLPILNELLSAGIKIELIVISEKGTKSRAKRELEVETFANQHQIELFIPCSTDELKVKLEEAESDTAVLAAYGKIISQDVIDSFEGGIINLHPSLLPRYRGPTPIESAILNCDSQTGVSIMQLTAGMDSGPVYAQQKLNLTGTESKQELADSLGLIGAKHIIEVLGNDRETNEQKGEPIICKLIQKSDSKLDLNKTAKQLECEVRAYLGWPSSKYTLTLKDGSELELIATEAQVTSNEPEPARLIFKTSEGNLEILKLKLPGKNEVTAKEFLNGYKSRF
jgi:methionyl-tRNA formyltransferase